MGPNQDELYSLFVSANLTYRTNDNQHERNEPNLMLAKASKGPSQVTDNGGNPLIPMPDLFSVQGSDCILEFPPMISGRDSIV